MGRSVHVSFLHIHCVFDALHRSSLLQRLVRSNILGKALQYFKAFSSLRSLYVKFGGVLSSARAISQGVPQGSVLGALLFNIALAALHECLPVFGFLAVRIAMCEDHIVL